MLDNGWVLLHGVVLMVIYPCAPSSSWSSPRSSCGHFLGNLPRSRPKRTAALFRRVRLGNSHVACLVGHLVPRVDRSGNIAYNG